MCGISGILKNKINTTDKERLEKINKFLIHRGPNDQGQWTNDTNLILGHTRLSIIDNTQHAAQPIMSKNSRYIMSFNGEIYNFKKLKKILLDQKKYNCLGTSDTEVLINCFEAWGVFKTLEAIIGMFAIAVFDKFNNKLYLIRDRLGEKPIYYYKKNDLFVFSSELGPISKTFPESKKINTKILSSYLNLNYIPSPYSIYENVYKLEPGNFLEINTKNLKVIKGTYFSCEKNFSHNYKNTNEENIISNLHEILKEVVNDQMIADVPTGTFLSGGTDSSLITALAQNNSSKKIKTFNISYNNPNYDESIYAKKIADIVGTDHTEYCMSNEDIKNIIPNLMDVYDEPFSDSSQIPTIFLCKNAKKHVGVALSGDAGDEIFGGYNRHLYVQKYWPLISLLPKWLKQIIEKNLNNKNFYDNFLIKNFFLKNKFVNIDNKLQKVLNSIRCENSKDLYNNLVSNESGINLVNNNPPLLRRINEIWNLKNASNLDKFMLADQTNYLTDDIFTKVDRASMKYSLEVRSPYADLRIIKYMSQLPSNLKIKNNISKYLLKKILMKYLPEKLVHRPKMGFGIPIGKLINENLKEWSNDLLSEDNLKKHHLFDSKKINYIINAHKKNKKDYGSIIWSILIFQSWYLKKFA